MADVVTTSPRLGIGFQRAQSCACRVLGLRELGDVGTGILQRDELATARQRDRIVKATLPAAISRFSLARINRSRVTYFSGNRLMKVAVPRVLLPLPSAVTLN
jgi:hypothetical protein